MKKDSDNPSEAMMSDLTEIDFETKNGDSHRFVMRKGGKSEALILAAKAINDDLIKQLTTLLDQKEVLEQERRRDALDGQAALDEANNIIKSLQSERDELRAEVGRYRWIPLSEKRPDPNTCVVSARIIDEKIVNASYGELSRVPYPRTHWMYLPPFKQPPQEPERDDPWNLNSCTHQECGRFYDHNARRMSCMAIVHGACACPAVQEQELSK